MRSTALGFAVGTVVGVILHYDDDCGLCTHCVRWLQDRTTGVLITPMSDELMVGNAVVLEAGDDDVLYGASAIAVVLSGCGQPWRVVGRFMRFPGVAVVAELVYRLIAKHRSRISSALGWGICELEPHAGSSTTGD